MATATTETQTHEPMWLFDRADRLGAILRRTRVAREWLYRELCDAQPSDRPALHKRRVIVEARVKKLAALSRTANRNARVSAGSPVGSFGG